MGLHGIDISDAQLGIDISKIVKADFVIVKVSGGKGYESIEWRRQARQVLDSGKLLGLYHYAQDVGYEGTASEEAAFFLSLVSGFEGRFVPALDVEAGALDLPQSWYKEWMDTVSSALGTNCLFYTGASAANSLNLDAVSDRPLWMASYLRRYFYTDFVDNPYNIWGSGPWESTSIYQYSSTGDVDGYDGDLDLDYFYGSREDWERMCGMAGQEPGAPVNDKGLFYGAHSQNLGYLPTVRDGQVAGTTGQGLALEALKINPPEGWELEAYAHIENLGWQVYTGIVHGNDILIGTTGRSLQIEMLGFRVVKRPEGCTDKLRFQVHQQNIGWKGWTDEGYFSGSDGMSARLEAVRLMIGE